MTIVDSTAVERTELDYNTPITIDTDFLGIGGGSANVLCCPHCGFQYLHHERITVYERKEEDAEPIVKTIIDGDKTTVEYVPARGSGNPSDRRYGFTIAFSCEGCDNNPVLVVEQTKGNTILHWRNGAVTQACNNSDGKR
jgi:hypothetical protein